MANVPKQPSDQLLQDAATDIWLKSLNQVMDRREEQGLPIFGLDSEVRGQIDNEVVLTAATLVFQLAGVIPQDTLLSQNQGVPHG